MCYTAKASISAWWILVLMSVFLWYRNEKYDRALSGFIFVLGLIQLIEYGIHSGGDASHGGACMYTTLMLQCLILSIGVFVFTLQDNDFDNPSVYKTVVATIAGWNLVLFFIVFVIALIIAFTANFSAAPGISGHIEWTRERGSFLGKMGIFYVIGIFVPLLLVFAYYRFEDLGIAILIIYGILSAGYVMKNYPPEAFSSMWCYLSVGFAFLAWFVGIIPASSNRCSV